MRPAPRFITLLILGGLFIGPSLRAEQVAACVFRAVDLSATKENAEYQSILTDMLRGELQNSGFRVLPAESWDPIREAKGLSDLDLLTGEKALAVAAEAGTELAVTGFYRVEDRQFVLEIKCYDVQAEAFVAGVLKTGRLNLSMYNLLDAAVKELLPEVRLIGKAPPVPGPASAEQITLLSQDEDAEIYLAGDKPVGIIRNGELILPPIPFPLGSRITVDKRKAGYHPSRESLPIEQPIVRFELKPLRRQTRWATEANWTFGQLLGLGAAQRYYFKPDASFVAGEYYFYIQNNFTGSLPVYHHDVKAVYGGYAFTGPDAGFRLGWSTGAGCILTHFAIPDQGLFTDFYLNLINVSLELNFRRWAVYLRSEGKYALGIGRDLLGRGWLNVADGPSPITLGMMWKW